MRLKQGQTIQVLYRSKPLVTLAAKENEDPYLADDAGTPTAIRRSIQLARQLSKRPVVFDPNKSFKELYEETQVL